jgi:hypothetical protein
MHPSGGGMAVPLEGSRIKITREKLLLSREGIFRLIESSLYPKRPQGS